MGFSSTLNSAAVIAALGYTPANNSHTHSGVYVPVDAGNGGVGSMAVLMSNSGLGVGSTVAGSTLRGAGTSAGGWVGSGGALSGTWRSIGNFSVGSSEFGTFQRIS